ncbi:hypothetical protein [Larkinella soli]|uniref:hypothetical protein n=1 Tax=Larkinella soli TaxID=1770527 RepID=UPI000FFB4642|nr:hypothetical protein [Larkinella soli]
MNNKTLGVLALLGAPAMYLGILAEEHYPSLHEKWWTGAWGITYITAFMISIVALRRMRVTGDTRFGRRLPEVLLGTLTLANVSNFWLLVAPDYRPTVYWVLDTFWPLSHLLMIPFGILVIRTRRLSGWRRYIPLLCGCWLPLAMATKFGVPAPVALFFGGIYNALAWCLLAAVVIAPAKAREPDLKAFPA